MFQTTNQIYIYIVYRCLELELSHLLRGSLGSPSPWWISGIYRCRCEASPGTPWLLPSGTLT